jgi:DNA-binding PadR family transcriptional regulator
MTRSRRPSAQTTAVVLALAEEPTAWRYGYQLCQQLGLKPGSLYPILVRLADRGLLETTWDTDVPAGRPPRHLYRLTGPGRVLAEELAAAPASPAKTARAVGRLGGVGRWSGVAMATILVAGFLLDSRLVQPASSGAATEG